MIRNVFTKTLYQKRFFILGWFIGLTFIITLTISFFPAFKQGGLDQTFSSLPDSVQKLVGNALSFKTMTGYIDQQIYAFRMPLLGIIMSIALLVGLSAGDEQKGLTETNIALPINRTRLLLEKLSAGFIVTALASIGSLLGVLLGLLITGENYSFSLLMHHYIMCAVLSFDLGLVAFAVGSITGRRALALGVGSGYAFLSYLVNSMATSVSYLQPIDKVTLLHYYNSGVYSTPSLLILVSVGILLTTISTAAFRHRDIRAN